MISLCVLKDFYFPWRGSFFGEPPPPINFFDTAINSVIYIPLYLTLQYYVTFCRKNQALFCGIRGHVFYKVDKGHDVLKLAVHGGKADVGNFVEFL